MVTRLGDLLGGVRRRTARLIALRAVRASGAHLGEGVTLIGTPIISIAPNSTLSIGSHVTIISDARSTALGVAHPTVIRTLLPGASIAIGHSTGVSGGSICAATSVKIGDRCLIGADVTITDTDFHPLEPEGRRHAPIPPPQPDDAVEIGDDVFIGTRSIVLKGSSIGSGAVIGAGSVVAGKIPPLAVAAGQPARVIRMLTPVAPVEPSQE